VQRMATNGSSGIAFCLRWALMAGPPLLICFGLGCDRGSEVVPPFIEKKAAENIGPNRATSASQANASTRSMTSLNFASRSIPALQAAHFSNGREGGLNSILEIVGGGVSCFDFDRDGLVDLAFATGGSISTNEVHGRIPTLTRGLGDWNFVECTRQARTDDDSLYTHGWSISDVDHDGFEDVLLYGYPGSLLWLNQGDGTFLRSEFSSPQWTTAVAWLDVDLDGHLDLYLGSYVDWTPGKNQVCETASGRADVCSPNVYAGVKNQCWINGGDGSFHLDEQVLASQTLAKSLGAMAAEFQPGKGTGLYVANDLVANFLFTRQPSGAFEEQAFSSGTALDDTGVANGSMGLALLDGNMDQVFDIFVANFEHELLGLYLGTGGELFNHSSRRMGLHQRDLQIVAFGVVAADFDGDADEDIVVVGGHVHYYPDRGDMPQKAFVLRNESGQRFVKSDVADPFFTQPMVGRGLAVADLNGNGNLDLVSTQLLGPPRVLENTAKPDESHWLMLNLVGTLSPRNPVGAIVELNVGAGQSKQVRQWISGGSYLSQSQSTLHFAWPREAGQEFEVRVRWPDGASIDTFRELAPNRVHTLVQGREVLP
jgi:enediyne biosynthesis protein E4